MAKYIERKARYIDAYSLGDKVFESKKNNPHCIDAIARNHNCEHEHFLKIIADEPTADVVEVVRCKGCIWWYPREYGSAIGRCENPYNGLANEYIEDDDFCSYGERKTDDESKQ